ncbi:MAG: hypothetical protein ACI85O_001494 [Saprospiraceae bacterium]|jgi:hypothetical protein
MKALIGSLIILFLVASCTEKTTTTLLTPIGKYNDRLDSISYEWTDSEHEVFDLSISRYADFREPSIDTTISGNQFLSTTSGSGKYLPNKTYYWKIDNSENEEHGSFYTFNPLKDIGGTYNVEMTRTLWGGLNIPSVDTTFIETISLDTDLRTVTLNFRDYELEHRFWDYNGELYVYDNWHYFKRNFMYIDIVNQEIEIKLTFGGMTSGSWYNATFNY